MMCIFVYICISVTKCGMRLHCNRYIYTSELGIHWWRKRSFSYKMKIIICETYAVSDWFPCDSHVHIQSMLCVNSSRPSDAIWRQLSWTTLAQVMACCLMAPSHYLNQYWLIIRGVLWHSTENSFAGIAQGINSGYEFEKDILKIIF